jgi:hypothetical protein
MLVGNELISDAPAVARENDVLEIVVAMVGRHAHQPHRSGAAGTGWKLDVGY